MGLERVVGNYDKQTNVSANIVESINKIGTGVKSMLNELNIANADFYKEGFVGMSASAKEDVKAAFKTYIDGIQEIIDGFKPTKELDEAIKGSDLQTAVYTYLDTIKYLLKGYVDILKKDYAEMDEAYDNFVNRAQKAIAGQFTDSSNEVKKSVESIIQEGEKINLNSSGK